MNRHSTADSRKRAFDIRHSSLPIPRSALCIVHCALCIAAAAATASAADLFVSASGTWVPEGLAGTCYTDLRAALDAAQNGDTVWLQDGYVYDSGNTGDTTGTNGGYARARIRNKTVVLRSESGHVDEAAGKGATIRGAWHDPENGVALGPNAVHCLWVSGANGQKAEVIGLVLEGGSGGNTHTGGYGGGIFGDGCIVSNCVLRNNVGYAGGAIGNGVFTLYNCVLTNNLCGAVGYSGGAIWGPSSAYNCLIVSNRSVTSGGGIGWNWSSGATPPVYSNCVIVGNVATNSGGAAYFAKNVGATFIGCRIAENTALAGWGGVNGPATLINCDVVGNSATASPCGGVGAGSGSAPQPVLTDCRIVGNYANREGGGLYYCVASNCVISGNLSRGSGGGAYASTLFDCEIVDNVCSNTLRTGNAMDGSGGGLCYGSATRCLVAGNSAWAQNLVSSGCGGGVALADLVNCVVSNNWALSRGAAVFYPGSLNVCHNTLFADNRSGMYRGVGGYYHGAVIEGMSANAVAADPAKFVNCTIADNYTGSFNALNGIVLVNTVVWNNTAATADASIVATNSCASYLADAHGPGNIQGDPLFADATAGDYTLGPRSPCRNAALRFDWMDAPADLRSRDLSGAPRLGGSLPDMGCYEHPFVRSLIGVR